MSEPRVVGAWCAGRKVEVPVKPAPVVHTRVACPSCGAQPGRECRDIAAGNLDYVGHASRKRQAELRYGARPV